MGTNGEEVGQQQHGLALRISRRHVAPACSGQAKHHAACSSTLTFVRPHVSLNLGVHILIASEYLLQHLGIVDIHLLDGAHPLIIALIDVLFPLLRDRKKERK